MDKLLPPKPLKWVIFILVVVVLAEVTGITAMIRGFAEKVTGPLTRG